MKRLLIISVALLMGMTVRAQEHFIEVLGERTIPARAQFDSLIVEFGSGFEGDRLPRKLRIYLRHSQEDTYVPVECTDQFYKEMRRAGYHNILYHRDLHGTHYDEAAKTFVDLFMLIIL